MPTAYVLGAGFSADLGFPLTKDLMAQVMTLAECDETKEINDYLCQVHLNFRPHLKNYPNIEDTLSLFRSQKAWKESQKDYDQIEKRIRMLMARFFLKKSAECRAIDALAHHIKFAQKFIRAGDSIITFNYDYIVDLILSMKSGEIEIAYKGNSPERVAVLKLHGSSGWFFKPLKVNNEYFTYREPIWSNGSSEIYALDPKKITGHNDVIPEILRVFEFESLIALPLDPRSPDMPGDAFLKEIWADAHSFLKSADRIVVVGYSLSTVNPAAKDLLRDGIHANPKKNEHGFLKVYDPDTQVKTRFEQWISHNTVHIPSRFVNSDLISNKN